MGSRNLRGPLAAFGLTLLAMLAFGVASATATEVDVQEETEDPSELEITDFDDDVDVVNVSLSGSTISITDTGPGGVTESSDDCVPVNAALVTCSLDPADDPPPDDPFLPIGDIDLELSDGNDQFGTTTSFDVFGGAGEGNDVINLSSGDDDIFGDDGNDQINGLGGDDFLDGGDGNDALNGGEGDDFFRDGGFGLVTGGTDTLIGGPGDDGADYFRDLAVNISLDKVANDGFPGENDGVDVENVNGGEGDDTLTGDDASNYLYGSDGDDTISTLGGTDTADGDDGDDTLNGGAAADQYFCGSGLDLAVLDVDDAFGPDCERTGAEITFDTATVSRKGVAKVPVTCAASEVANCTGKLELTLNGKRVAKGKFDVAPGDTKRAKAKLSKSGKKSLKRNGGTILVKAEATTDTPAGASTTEDDVLLQQKKGKGKKKGGGKK